MGQVMYYELTDRVLYKLPLGLFGRLVHPLIVRRQLHDIFTYRRSIIGRHLTLIRPLQEVTIRPLH